jgi:hypothetical protein
MSSLDAVKQTNLLPLLAAQRVAIPNELSRLIFKEKVHRNNTSPRIEEPDPPL